MNEKPQDEITRPLDDFVKLRDFIREHQKGGCKVISEGLECQCPLCALDRIIARLHWYGEIAGSLARYGAAKKDQAMLACITELMLDAGRKAFGA